MLSISILFLLNFRYMHNTKWVPCWQLIRVAISKKIKAFKYSTLKLVCVHFIIKQTLIYWVYALIRAFFSKNKTLLWKNCYTIYVQSIAHRKLPLKWIQPQMNTTRNNSSRALSENQTHNPIPVSKFLIILKHIFLYIWIHNQFYSKLCVNAIAKGKSHKFVFFHRELHVGKISHIQNLSLIIHLLYI